MCSVQAAGCTAVLVQILHRFASSLAERLRPCWIGVMSHSESKSCRRAEIGERWQLVCYGSFTYSRPLMTLPAGEGGMDPLFFVTRIWKHIWECVFLVQSQRSTFSGHELICLFFFFNSFFLVSSENYLQIPSECAKKSGHPKPACSREFAERKKNSIKRDRKGKRSTSNGKIVY